MKQFYFECQPWHVEREGADEALARMAGEIGVDGVQLRVAGSGLAAFYPRGPQGPHIDSCDSGLQFQLDASKYSGVRTRPRVASWMKSRNPLDAVCKLAERHRLRVRVLLPGNIPMPERSSSATIINALGDISPATHCLAHPDTGELFGALVDDLSHNYPFDVVVIAAPRRPTVQAAFDVPNLPSPDSSVGLLNELLAWCFCPACRQQAQAAGADARQVQKRVTNLILKSLNPDSSPPQDLDAVLVDDSVLAGYQKWQNEASCSLVRHLRERCRATLALRADETGYPVDSPAAELKTWGSICERLIFRAVHGGSPEDSSNVRALGAVIAAEQASALQASAGLKVDLTLPSCPPEVRDGPHLVSLAHEAAQTGCEAIIFQDYATSPDTCLDWVRQAIRYARREST